MRATYRILAYVVAGLVLVQAAVIVYAIAGMDLFVSDGGVKWAATVLGLVVLQVILGMALAGVPSLGILHGLNAFALFACAVVAGRRVTGRRREPAAAPSTRAAI